MRSFMLHIPMQGPNSYKMLCRLHQAALLMCWYDARRHVMLMQVIFYITRLAGETRIIRCKPDFGPVHEDNSFHLTEKLVREDIRFAVETELLGGSVLEMKDLVQAFNSRMAFNNCTYDRTYSRQRIMIKNYLISPVPTIQFEDSVSNKSSQRIISKDLQNLA